MTCWFKHNWEYDDFGELRHQFSGLYETYPRERQCVKCSLKQKSIFYTYFEGQDWVTVKK